MIRTRCPALAQRGITFSWTDTALEALADAAHGGKRGARDLRNVIRRKVENVLATEIVARHEVPPAAVTVDAVDGEIVLQYA